MTSGFPAVPFLLCKNIPAYPEKQNARRFLHTLNVTQEKAFVSGTCGCEAGEEGAVMQDILKEAVPKPENLQKNSVSKNTGENIREIRNLVFKLIVVVAATLILMNYVFGIFILRGNYMFPAVRDGDLMLTYRLEDYSIGDVVMYEHEDKERIGRIIATEGMEVSISETGELMIDGAIPAEQIFYLTDQGTQKYPYKVKEGEIFIMNDFRSDTNDSRSFGSVNRSALDGKCIFIIRRRGF